MEVSHPSATVARLFHPMGDNGSPSSVLKHIQYQGFITFEPRTLNLELTNIYTLIKSTIYEHCISVSPFPAPLLPVLPKAERDRRPCFGYRE
jgi:hypothetical protein